MTPVSDTRLTCKHCSAVRYVLFDDCLENGWPTHCGATMRLDRRPSGRSIGRCVKQLLERVARKHVDLAVAA